MKISVTETPNCTWVLDGGSFWCTHEKIEIVTDVVYCMTFDGPEQYEVDGYACVECGEPIDGSPVDELSEEFYYV